MNDIRKCRVCGYTKFEFVFQEKVEKPGEITHEIGYYKCKKCGVK